MPELRNRKEFERFIRQEFVAVGKANVDRLIKLLGDPPNPANVPMAFWRRIGADMAAQIKPTLADIYLVSAKQMLDVGPIHVDWTLINQNAAGWASTYSFDLVRKINATSRQRLQETINSFFTEQRTVGATRAEIQQYIPDLLTRSGRILTSEQRAKLIATTEVTRASVQGEKDVVDQLAERGTVLIPFWVTQHDAKVCDICRPLDGHAQGDGWEEPPPDGSHPGCYCNLRYEFPRR